MSSVRGWLLDTNVVSELRRGKTINRNVKLWSDSLSLTDTYLSMVTIVEIRAGIERCADPVRRADLARWLADEVRAVFQTRILGADEDVLLAWRSLLEAGRKANYTYSQPDALIAATAVVHGLGVATRNTADFARAGIALVNPWHPVV